MLFQYFTFFIEEHRTFSSFLVCQNNLIGLAAILRISSEMSRLAPPIVTMP